MKFYQFFILVLLTLGSCKASKSTLKTSEKISKLSARKLIKKHNGLNFPTLIDAKLKVNYSNNKEKLGISVRMKMIKDEVIWLKGSKVITIFKAKITPQKVSFYSPYKKSYFEGDFSMLTQLLGVELNFTQLQNLLLGQAIFPLKKNEQTIAIIDNSYSLYPKVQSSLFNVFYNFSPKTFKLKKQLLINPNKNQKLDISYPKYLEKNNLLFPKQIKINTKEKNKFSTIDINIRSIEFNKKIITPFKIPLGYQEIKL